MNRPVLMNDALTTYKKILLWSQLTFYATISICVALAPGSLTANAGFSYFGHQPSTGLLFTLGLLICSCLLLEAHQKLGARPGQLFLWLSLLLLTVSIFGVAVAPAIGNGWLNKTHQFFGTSTFIIQLLISGWLMMKCQRDAVNLLLFCLQFGGGYIAFMYLIPEKGYSFEGQLLFQLAFSGLLFRNIILGSASTPSLRLLLSEGKFH